MVGYALKADIAHYFEEVDHEILLSILRRKIRDDDLLWLVGVILSAPRAEFPGKGMPLGNLTSQFLANVYLGELDGYVKRELRAKYYLRYVDDFVILSRSREELERHRRAIDNFLSARLHLRLHPQKTKITPLRSGLTLLGFRQFYHFRLLKKSNQRRIRLRIGRFGEKLARGQMPLHEVRMSMAGWEGYATMADTYWLRMELWASISDFTS